MSSHAALETMSAEELAAFFDVDLVTAAAMQRTLPSDDSPQGAAAAGTCPLSNTKAAARLAREIAQVRCDGAKFGFEVRRVTCAKDHVSVVASLVGPPGSPFEGGVFIARFRFEAGWPFSINRRTFFAFETPILHHPNILLSGRIDCRDFGDSWNPGKTQELL